MTRRKKRHALLTGLLLTAGTTQAGYYFDPAFLSEDPQTVADLSAFEQGLTAPPGTYRVDVFLNGQLQGNRPLRFIAGSDKTLQACLTRGELEKLGVRTAAFPALSAQHPDACTPLAQVIPQADSRADISRQRLDIRLPQAALLRDARGYIPPSQWDNGIPAALFNYSLSGGNQLNSDGGATTAATITPTCAAASIWEPGACATTRRGTTANSRAPAGATSAPRSRGRWWHYAAS
nr:FimD/PapC N-terminal domain-containing protein [Serratia sp. S4]